MIYTEPRDMALNPRPVLYFIPTAARPEDKGVKAGKCIRRGRFKVAYTVKFYPVPKPKIKPKSPEIEFKPRIRDIMGGKYELIG